MSESRPELRVALRREVAEARHVGLGSRARAHPEDLIEEGSKRQREDPSAVEILCAAFERRLDMSASNREYRRLLSFEATAMLFEN